MEQENPKDSEFTPIEIIGYSGGCFSLLIFLVWLVAQAIRNFFSTQSTWVLGFSETSVLILLALGIGLLLLPHVQEISFGGFKLKPNQRLEDIGKTQLVGATIYDKKRSRAQALLDR
jgi:hypothetical protein